MTRQCIRARWLVQDMEQACTQAMMSCHFSSIRYISGIHYFFLKLAFASAHGWAYIYGLHPICLRNLIMSLAEVDLMMSSEIWPYSSRMRLKWFLLPGGRNQIT